MSGSLDSRTPRQRTPRRGSAPTFSVVITSRGNQSLVACMTRLGEACLRGGAEIIIVVQGPDREVAAVRKQYPEARVVGAAADLSPHDLRSQGLLEASGDIVAFTDAEESRGEEWLSVLERRCRNAGGYGPSPNGSVDWARYLEENGLLSRNGPRT
ncbi:MAG TPA: hypothetical protein VK922_10995 [Gemmatimonadaceae bacterium]|nr:hypothetical protein [Gemmatimonadaceae bacterium]